MAFDPTKFGATPVASTTFDPTKFGATPIQPIAPEIKTPGVSFQPKTTDTPLTAGLKTLGNIPGSAINFAKGAIQSLNPLNIPKTLKEIASPDITTDTTAIPLGGAILKEIPGELYKTLVPSSLRNVLSGNLEQAQLDIVSDPVGQIAPFLLSAKGLTKGIDKRFGTATEAGFESAMSKTAGTVTKPISTIAAKGADIASSVTKSAASHITGLEPKTISKIIENPEAFSKIARDQVDRGGLAGEFGTAITKLEENLGERGTAYDSVRALPNEIAVPENFISKSLDKFGLKIGEGNKIIADTKSATRNTSDINAIQKFVDDWASKESLTPDEFLNMRSDLADLANYDKLTGMGKTKTSQVIADALRQDANTTMRPQIKGLKDLDSEYSSVRTEFDKIKKDFLTKDNEGNYTFKDGAINKIANATGVGKEKLLSRMESISPGITKRIEILKAVEDIERASGNKVGAYTRGIIGGGAILTGNAAAVVASIISNPSIAVPLIRGYAATGAKIAPVINALKTIGGDINNLRIPEQVKDYMANPKMGFSVEDVSQLSRIAKEIDNNDKNIMADFVDGVRSKKLDKKVSSKGKRLAEIMDIKSKFGTNTAIANAFNTILDLERESFKKSIK